MEYIRWGTSERRARDWSVNVRKEIYSQFSFITINCLQFHSTYILISFLKMHDTRETLLQESRIRALAEELSGLLLREVVNRRGEHYTEDAEQLIPRDDEI